MDIGVLTFRLALDFSFADHPAIDYHWLMLLSECVLYGHPIRSQKSPFRHSGGAFSMCHRMWARMTAARHCRIDLMIGPANKGLRLESSRSFNLPESIRYAAEKQLKDEVAQKKRFQGEAQRLTPSLVIDTMQCSTTSPPESLKLQNASWNKWYAIHTCM